MNKFIDHVIPPLRKYISSGERPQNPAWIQGLKEKALDDLKSLPFPNKKMEAFKYSKFRGLEEKTFSLAGNETLSELPEWAQKYIDLENQELFVFVNGKWSEELSKFDKKNGNFIALSFQEALSMPKTAAHLKNLWNQEKNSDVFQALWQSHTDRGLYLEICPEKKAEKTIHLLHLQTKSKENILSTPSHFIVASKFSKAAILESYLDIELEDYLQIGGTHILVEEGANLEHIKLQYEGENAHHLVHQNIYVKKDATISSFLMNLGAKNSRHDMNIFLQETGAHAELSGIYTLQGEQQSEHYLEVHHQVSHTTSNQYYKGVLDHDSHGVFSGKVIVNKMAKPVNALQLNRNLLLSKKAKINTQPQMEIYADDVKCQHGATIGQLSDDELFYLESRGIDAKKARKMLSHAFAYDALMKISDEATKDFLGKVLNGKISLKSKKQKEITK